MLSIFVHQANAQLSPEFLALNSIERGKWEKAKNQLVKALKKDSLNAGALYGYSRLYFTPDNPDYQIDSAYKYVLKAQSVLGSINEKQRDRWRKLPLDSLILHEHKQRIDSAAFKRTVTINTEAGYTDFITRFKSAAQLTRASELRDEVSYIDALKENTYQSFERYVSTYPNSSRVKEAKARYEKLLFEAKTRDKKLTSYESFLENFPATPYRSEVELQIFQIMTASGEPMVFEKFITRYPKSSLAKTAQAILYHTLKELDERIPTTMLTDSLKRTQQLTKSYLVPILKDGFFGFMNEYGEQIVKPKLQQIDARYLCGNIMDELIVGNDIVIARTGSVLFKGEIDDYEELGFGFLKIVSNDSCVTVLHYSGFTITNEGCLEDAKILGSNFLALKQNGNWGIYAFTGRMLLPFEWDEIEQIGSIIVLNKSQKAYLVSTVEVARSADNNKISLLKSYDDVVAWPDNKIWTARGGRQQVLTQKLTPWIEEDQHELVPAFFGAITKTIQGYSLVGEISSNEIYTSIKINKPWVIGKQQDHWYFIDSQTFRKNSTIQYDSISFNGPLAVSIFGDSLHVYYSKSSFLRSTTQSKIQFIPGRDSVFYFAIEESDKKRVYDRSGSELFSIVADKIEYNNEGFFTITKKDKRGLLDVNGKVIIPIEYEAVGPIQNGIVSILKEKKFGLINLTNKLQVKVEHEKNITSYSSSTLVGYKNGAYGFIGWNNKPLSNFEFEEVFYWNDSVAWVKKNFNWKLYHIFDKKIFLDKVKRFKWVENTAEERVLIIQQENDFGVISNKNGIIIQPTFSDIINVGSSENPLYFTEKHVEEASIFVVIYYSKAGIQLLRQIFEEEDYDRIYCSGK